MIVWVVLALLIHASVGGQIRHREGLQHVLGGLENASVGTVVSTINAGCDAILSCFECAKADKETCVWCVDKSVCVSSSNYSCSASDNCTSQKKFVTWPFLLLALPVLILLLIAFIYSCCGVRSCTWFCRENAKAQEEEELEREKVFEEQPDPREFDNQTAKVDILS
mmetsp:Transcript_3834/g.7042  ORF Transcript_3834/g.7042 Transcript_3834/m.7042 type:complete len:167 (+) Transcript_3834:249-749(+)